MLSENHMIKVYAKQKFCKKSLNSEKLAIFRISKNTKVQAGYLNKKTTEI